MSSSRREGFRRKYGFRKPKKHFHIATEGNETEPRYFELFKTQREDLIQLKVIPSKHKSHPREVLKRLTAKYKMHGRKGDEAWLVIDRDAWEEADLDLVCRQAKELGFHVALSNPCFELWLFLHFRDNDNFSHRAECQSALGRVLPGYSPDKKSQYDTSSLRTNLGQAIQRAAALEPGLDVPWPRRQCTRVYLLMRQIRGVETLAENRT